MSIYEKLGKIQSQLKAPKNQYNAFGKYSYRSCEDILEALKPLLAETKTILTIADDIVQITDRYYIKATATLVDIETGEKIETSAWAREEENKKGMDASQITGSASSYARKYALNGLFCIDDTKDSDATNTNTTQGEISPSTKQNNNVRNKPATQKQLNLIFKICNDNNIDKETAKGLLKEQYGVESTKGLTKDQASQFIEYLLNYENAVKEFEGKGVAVNE